ncbi:MAG: heterodisulfide reductase, partial [Acidobacteriota bacterium]
MHQTTSLSPDFAFLDMVEAAGPFHTSECFQCRKCSNGCPASFAMDLYPDQIIRLALLGQKDEILRSRTLWV